MTDLQSLYDSKLQPRLAALEGERQKLQRAIVSSALVVGIPVVCFWQSDVVSLALPQPARVAVAPVAFILIVAGAITAVVTFAIPGITAYLNYRTRFKREVVAEIFAAVCPGSTYDADRHVSKEIFEASGIFSARGGFRGDDLVRGTIGRTPFEASEIERQYSEGSGKDSKTYHVFHGLFFHLDFNKTIHGRTIVQSVKANGVQLLARPDMQAVTLEDPAFEQEFTVWATNPVEARYILTPALMESILDIRRTSGKPIYLAFAGSSVYVAVQYGASLFEPSIAGTTSFAALKEMASHFTLADVIVRELDLNTRIWTKDVDASLLEKPAETGAFAFSELGDAAGHLDEAGLMRNIAKKAGEMYQDGNAGPRPEAPDRTRVRFDTVDDGLLVRYRLKWWFVPCLVIALAAAVVEPAALVGVVSPETVAPEAGRVIAAAASPLHLDDLHAACVVLAIAVPILALLPAWMALAYVRRVRIGRDEILVTRGLRLTARRYPLSEQSRILQMQTAVYLAKANEFKLVNVSLSPVLDSPLEARWVAWHMREALGARVTSGLSPSLQP